MKQTNKKGNVIAGSIALAVAVIITITVTFSLINPSINALSITSEAITLVNDTAVALDQDDLVSVTGIGNATTELLTTQYSTDLTAGTIRLLNASYAGNFLVNYSYHDGAYIDESTPRSIVSNLPIILAVGLIVLAIIVFGIAKG